MNTLNENLIALQAYCSRNTVVMNDDKIVQIKDSPHELLQLMNDVTRSINRTLVEDKKINSNKIAEFNKNEVFLLSVLTDKGQDEVTLNIEGDFIFKLYPTDLLHSFTVATNKLLAYCEHHDVQCDEFGFIDDAEDDEKLESLKGEVVVAFEQHFITLMGNPDVVNINLLEDTTKHRIRAGETDNFGWVTAVISLAGTSSRYSILV